MRHLQPELDQPYQPADHMAANRELLVAYFANNLDEHPADRQDIAEHLAQQVIGKMAGIDTLPGHLHRYLLVGVSMVKDQMLECRMVADDGSSAILRVNWPLAC
jgi:hypothetical protein